MFDTDSYTI